MYKKIYLSGKITGLSYEEAFVLFEAAEQEAKKYAEQVCNPMKLLFTKFQPADLQKPTWGEYMVNDLDAIMNDGVDSIFMLRNWQESKGAKIENFIAQQINLQFVYQDSIVCLSWEPVIKKYDLNFKNDYNQKKY